MHIMIIFVAQENYFLALSPHEKFQIETTWYFWMQNLGNDGKI